MRRFVVFLFIVFLMAPVACSLADDHHKGGKHFRHFTRTVYRFHTHPAVLSSILLILLTGHLVVD